DLASPDDPVRSVDPAPSPDRVPPVGPQGTGHRGRTRAAPHVARRGESATLPSAAVPSRDVLAALSRVVRALPGGGEARDGQAQMAGEVAEALASGRHLVVRAGTGTGKTLGYLVPAVLSGQRVVVATATKALQDQLAGKDLPFLEQHLGVPFDWALLKGRANYVCVQRLAEIAAANGGTSPPPVDHPDGGPDDRGPGAAAGPSGTPPAAQLSLDGFTAAADPDE